MKFYKSCISIIISVIFLNIIVHILIWHIMVVNERNKNLDEDAFKEYLIYNSKCKIPDYESYDKFSLSYIENEKYHLCWYPWYNTVSTKIYKENGTAFLVVGTYPRFKNVSFSCCYCNVTPASTKPDYEIEVSACKFFKDKVQVTHDMIYAKCYMNNNTVVYENIHAIISANRSNNYNLSDEGKSPKRPNVLVLGLSSVSRIIFHKIFPRTYLFLKENGWIEYTAFNIVGDKSNNVNLIAMLTGNFNVSSDSDESFATDSDFIWRDFRKMGYVTAYVKDSLDNGVLENSKLGFQYPPTDFYFRHYVVATHMLFKLNRYHCIYCTGPETTVERILNLAMDFLTELRQRNTFSIFWMDGFARKHEYALEGLDEMLKNFFLYLHRSKILRNTLVLFLSDKGNDYIDSKTLKGWYSKQLPFLYMWIPPMLKRKYPKEYTTILENRNILTTPFDLYLTMQDILAMYSHPYDLKKSRDCPECFSLFTNNSNLRSCKEASIGDEWCSCLGYTKLANSAALAKLAEDFVIANAQRMIKERKNGYYVCVKIKSKKINYAWLSDNTNYDENTLRNYLQISIDTNIGISLGAKLLVSYKNGTSSFELIGDLLGFGGWYAASHCFDHSWLSYFDTLRWFYYI